MRPAKRCAFWESGVDVTCPRKHRGSSFVISNTNLIHTSLFHFIEVHSLDMFRALLAHAQEALHKRRVGDCCVRL
jgi:hypothetical protein